MAYRVRNVVSQAEVVAMCNVLEQHGQGVVSIARFGPAHEVWYRIADVLAGLSVSDRIEQAIDAAIAKAQSKVA